MVVSFEVSSARSASCKRPRLIFVLERTFVKLYIADERRLLKAPKLARSVFNTRRAASIDVMAARAFDPEVTLNAPPYARSKVPSPLSVTVNPETSASLILSTNCAATPAAEFA